MKWSTEQKVRDAIRFGDSELLAEAVQGDRFLDYDELEQFVGEQVGGYRHVSWRGVQVGATTVIDKFGRPLVTGALILAMAAAAVLNTGTAAAAGNGQRPMVNGQWSTVEEGPILGPGPCSSETPWGCFRFQVWMPVVMAE